RSSSCVTLQSLLQSAGNQDRERIARFAGTDIHTHITQTSAAKERVQFGARKAEVTIAESFAYPRLVVRAQVENQQPAARAQDARGLCNRPRGVVCVMQRLREQRDVNRAVAQRQANQITLLPGDVADMTPRGERPGALEHVR